MNNLFGLKVTYKKKNHRNILRSLLLAGAVLAGTQAGTLRLAQAAELRMAQTRQMLETAVEDLEDGSYVQGQALVTMEAGEAAALVQEGRYRYDSKVKIAEVSEFGETKDGMKKRYIVHLTSDVYTTEQLMELALRQYYVDGVAPNGYQYLMGTDTYRAYQWGLDGAGTDSKGIRLAKQSVTMQKTPVIAVLDTGINYLHPDLAEKMWVNPYPDKLRGVNGYDFGDDDEDPMDDQGHGTHVAGIAAAAQDNGIGITGVSAARLMALKITKGEDSEISDAAIVAAYNYVYEAIKAGVNIKVVNCSWGGNSDTNGVLAEAVNAVGKLGALSVFAAGNDGRNWDKVKESAYMTPYDLDSPYVVIVGASNEQDEAAYYSDYSAGMVDLFAPGSNIISTYMENTYLPRVYDDQMQSRLSCYYNQCSNELSNILPEGQSYQDIYTAAQLGIPTSYTVKAELVREGAEGYLRMEVSKNLSPAGTDGYHEEAGSIYVDVTDLQLDQDAVYYVGYMDGVGENGELCWQSGQMVSEKGKSRFINKDGRTYMRIVGLQIPNSGVGKKNIWYLDDLAISKANPDTDRFGSYAYMEGTSMSAPMVSGALATLAGANPTLDAAKLRTMLLKCVRRVSGLSDKCRTGGILDCSRLYTRATKVTLNKTSATVAYGKTLTLKAKVSPATVTNAKVTWKSSNTKYAKVTGKGVVKPKKAGIGHSVTITATAADGSKKKAVCKIRIKK